MTIKIGRRHEKRWGVIFTLAHSLNTDSAIMALQRMAARRGFPITLYSDNGTNFRGASKELKDLISTLDTKSLQEYSALKNFQWKFNPPCAPDMGGVWERLIRSVKNALKVILNEQVTRDEVLVTIFAEIEHLINSRPLTKV